MPCVFIVVNINDVNDDVEDDNIIFDETNMDEMDEIDEVRTEFLMFCY